MILTKCINKIEEKKYLFTSAKNRNGVMYFKYIICAIILNTIKNTLILSIY